MSDKKVESELIPPEVDGFVFQPPLCVFCSAPWTEDMMKISAEVETENGYYGDVSMVAAFACVDITCSTCKRLVYRKEIRCTDVSEKW